MAEKTMLFDAGLVVRTQAAMVALVQSMTSETSLIERHQSGDWGDVSSADRDSNDQALETGGRLFSSYRLRCGSVVWVITEADRDITTVMVPADY